MINIRPFVYTDEEYAQLVDINNVTWPEYPDTVSEWKHEDETREPKYLYCRDDL